ncbi:MAG: hypothetical protein AAF404_22415, partial [Pseudomonadota bacterium]
MSNITKMDFLDAERRWFEGWLQCRVASYFDNDKPTVFPPAPPLTGKPADAYQQAVEDLALTEKERLVLMLALVLWIKPDALDLLHTKNTAWGLRYSEFGSDLTQANGRFQPTVQTALFVLAGDNVSQSQAAMALLSPDGSLVKAGTIEISPTGPGEPDTAAVLGISSTFIRKITGSETSGVTHGRSLPPHRLTTRLKPNELVVSA